MKQCTTHPSLPPLPPHTHTPPDCGRRDSILRESPHGRTNLLSLMTDVYKYLPERIHQLALSKALITVSFRSQC